MDFQLIRQIVSEIINAIQNSAVAAVKAIRETITTHTYPVEVKNPQKEVSVKGSVKVENPTDLKEVIKALENLTAILPTLKKVVVENQIEIPNYPKFPEFPKSVEVSNLPKISFEKDAGAIVSAVDDVKKAVAKLKLNPEIKVASPVIPTPIVNVPASNPVVNVEKPDLSAMEDLLVFWQNLTGNAKKALSVRLTDGKEFYKAVDKLVEIAGSRSVSPFVTMDGMETRALVDRQGRLVVAATIDTVTEGFAPEDDLTITDETVGLIQTIVVTNGTKTKTVTINNSTGETTIVWT